MTMYGKRGIAALLCSLVATGAHAVPPWVKACEAAARADVGNPRGFKLVEPGAIERGENVYMVSGKGIWREKAGQRRVGVACVMEYDSAMQEWEAAFVKTVDGPPLKESQ
ncbi:hypothetical protein AU476_01140 [Cupriavidus sp. UYMSc13B]|nr:hypothetical protein AU476_01140 [Cupriavidus sp. UYMSc13B]